MTFDEIHPGNYTHTAVHVRAHSPLNDCAIPFGSNRRPSSAIDLGVAEAHAGSIARHLAPSFLPPLVSFTPPRTALLSSDLIRRSLSLSVCLPNIFCHYLEGHGGSHFGLAPL